jgi:hypothetical protein
VIGNAVHVMRIATRQITEDVTAPESEGKDPAAVALRRRREGASGWPISQAAEGNRAEGG